MVLWVVLLSSMEFDEFLMLLLIMLLLCFNMNYMCILFCGCRVLVLCLVG